MSVSLRKKHKNPKGGLSAKGRAAYNAATGSKLKPGVKKKESEMSAGEMKRKGSFLRRHYGRKDPHPLKKDNGEPTRYALQATAWGESAPSNVAAVRRLANKGTRLLERAKKMNQKQAYDMETAKRDAAAGMGHMAGSMVASPLAIVPVAGQLAQMGAGGAGGAYADRAMGNQEGTDVNAKEIAARAAGSFVGAIPGAMVGAVPGALAGGALGAMAGRPGLGAGIGAGLGAFPGAILGSGRGSNMAADYVNAPAPKKEKKEASVQLLAHVKTAQYVGSQY